MASSGLANSAGDARAEPHALLDEPRLGLVRQGHSIQRGDSSPASVVLKQEANGAWTPLGETAGQRGANPQVRIP